jgi:hypothetical protein
LRDLAARAKRWQAAPAHPADEPLALLGQGERLIGQPRNASRREIDKAHVRTMPALVTGIAQRSLRFLDERRRPLLLASLFLIVIGSRAIVINYAGNPTPYADEWDGEAANLLKPYLDGALTTRDLFRAHNEHVVFFTRLLTLGIFNLSGYWDVVLQMIANAILDAATIVAISYALSRPLRGALATAAMVLSASVSALPLSYDNILLGFNTHFYLLLAFSFASLWLMADSRAWSPRWAAGALFGLASFLCMASGALTLAAVLGLHLAQMACGRRRGMREWLGIAALAAAVAVLASLIPHVPDSDVYRAHSLWQFLAALFQIASWPAPPNLGSLMTLPSVIFCLRTFADRPGLNDPRWFNFAAFGWAVTQFMAIAAGRALIPLETRYLDTLLIGLAVNMTSFVWLATTDPSRTRWKTWWSIALTAWLVIVAASLVYPKRPLPGSMELRRRTAETQENNLRGYLATGDASYLAGAPLMDIPYPEATRLRQLLDTSEIRAVLPSKLLSRDAPSNWVEAFKRTFLAQGYTWLGGGVLLLLLTIIAGKAPAPAGPTVGGPQAVGRPIQDFRKVGRASPGGP